MPSDDAIAGSVKDLAADPEPPRRLIVDVIEEAGDWSSLGAFVAIIAPVLATLGTHARLASHMPAEACVALLDDAAMRRLNGQFRAKDKPTNVLSFPSGLPSGNGERRRLGDIALGYETVVREAADQGISAQDHVRHLVLHGLLHLMGFDHETDDAAEAMEALEIEILARVGVANPYDEEAVGPQRS